MNIAFNVLQNPFANIECGDLLSSSLGWIDYTELKYSYLKGQSYVIARLEWHTKWGTGVDLYWDLQTGLTEKQNIKWYQFKNIYICRTTVYHFEKLPHININPHL